MKASRKGRLQRKVGESFSPILLSAGISCLNAEDDANQAEKIPLHSLAKVQTQIMIEIQLSVEPEATWLRCGACYGASEEIRAFSHR